MPPFAKYHPLDSFGCDMTLSGIVSSGYCILLTLGFDLGLIPLRTLICSSLILYCRSLSPLVTVAGLGKPVEDMSCAPGALGSARDDDLDEWA